MKKYTLLLVLGALNSHHAAAVNYWIGTNENLDPNNVQNFTLRKTGALNAGLLHDGARELHTCRHPEP